MSQPPLIFLIAGEASGDLLGADLMVSLKKMKEVRFAGIGGEAMTAQGLKSLFPMQELSIMGVFGILRNLGHLWKRLTYTVETIERLNPDIVVTIDAPEFSFRVMKRLQKMPQRPRLIHYVAPTVWAWRPGRAKKIARFLDSLLCLYPFEPPYFEKYGLKTTFVGHPIAKESHMLDEDTGLPRPLRGLAMTPPLVIASGAKQSRKKIIGGRDPNLLCVLPGSRRSEIEKLLPIFKETVALLKKDVPDLKVVIPTLPSVKLLVQQGVENWPLDLQIVVGDQARKEAFQQASAALAASGTVALQLSAAGLPFVIAYKVGKVTEWLGRFFIKTPWVCMINILLAFNKFGPNFVLNWKVKNLIPNPWIPEFIQQDCVPEKMAPTLLTLLKNLKERRDQIEAMDKALSLLITPPETAGRIILETLS